MLFDLWRGTFQVTGVPHHRPCPQQNLGLVLESPKRSHAAQGASQH
jgi:hypothetical protein